MATRTQVILVDDISGKEITEGQGGNVTFGLDGVTYSIDLSTANADKLRGALAGYIAAGTRVAGRRSSSSRGTASESSAREIRDWARSNGIDVPERGRIPSEVRDAFESR